MSIFDNPQFVIQLPWPDRALSPNARLSWQAKKTPKQEARGAGKICALDALGGRPPPDLTGDLKATFEFNPPIKPRRDYDLDNLLASMKSYIDGVADALGFNDKQITQKQLWLNHGGTNEAGYVTLILEQR